VFFKRSSVQQKQALLHKVCKIMLALYFIIMLEARRENGKVARGRNEPSKSAHANNNENNCHIIMLQPPRSAPTTALQQQ
jgi:hypothetical protein